MDDFELCISLDSNGRTNFNNKPDDDTSTTTQEQQLLDYNSKAVQLSVPFRNRDELLFDCEVADCGLMPRTFWMPSNGAPRCALERMALDVFRHHMPDDSPAASRLDANTSGAEWWVQIRPSVPKSGRYAMLAGDDVDNDDVMAGISFHWDKDEELRIHTGMFIHPHISTVTYMTDIGAPTFVIDKRVDYISGVPIAEQEGNVPNGFCSWPKSGKHLSFDGRYLHAAPSDFMEKGAFQKQCQVPNVTKEADLKSAQRYHRRITFLVNIWINHRPIGVNPFPETMLDKLSKCDSNEESIFSGYIPCKEVEQLVINEAAETQKFTWPIGGCSSTDSRLKLYAPLGTIKNQMKGGGTINMKWESSKSDLLVIVNSDEQDDDSSGGNKRKKHT